METEVAASPARVRATSLGKRALSALALVPPLAWIVLLVVVPLAIMVAFSFWTVQDYRIYSTWTSENYLDTLGSRLWRILLGRTLLTALAVAAIATAISFPVALFVSRHLRRLKVLAVLLMLIPLWVSFLLRAYTWKVILGREGILNSFLLYIGLIDEPLDALLYNRFAVILALVYVSIPFVFTPIYVSLERIPKDLVWAAGDLGANGLRSTWNIVIPLALPGLITGFAFSFVLAVGDFVTPTLVGGTSGTMVGALIASQFGLAFNWPLGAAMALILLLVVVVFLGIIQRFARVEARLS
jgi:spermidine/putrescine transport system permease protein